MQQSTPYENGPAGPLMKMLYRFRLSEYYG